MEWLIEGVQYIADMFSDSDHGFWIMLQAKIVIWWTQLKLLALQNAWSVAQAVLDEIELTSTLESFYAQLDVRISSFLSLLKIPEVINLLINAHVTRYVLGLIK